MPDESNSGEKLNRLPMNEAFFHRMVDAVPSMVWMSNAAGEAKVFNSKWYELTGQTPESAKNLGWLDVVHPEDRPRLLDSIGEKLDRQFEFEIEVRYRMIDGSYRWHMVRALRDSGEKHADCWYGISVDIDEIYASEEMFEAQTRAIVDAAVDCIITIDSAGIIRSVNPAINKIFGYSESDVLGKNVNLLMPEPDRSSHDSYISLYFY